MRNNHDIFLRVIFNINNISGDISIMNFVQWVSKLGLQQENFKIVKKKEYPGISLRYIPNTDIWEIVHSEYWEKFHLIHKLGYIWLWKQYKVLDYKKREVHNDYIIKELRSIHGTVMDAISYFRLSDMDLDFKEDYINSELNKLLYAYNGRFPPETTINTKIGLYTFCYLKYFKFFPESIRKKHDSIINYFINNIQKQIMDSSRKDKYPLTREIFNNLRIILDDFDLIKNSEVYKDIIDYSLQIAKTLPFWSEEYLIEQFSRYYNI